MPESVTTPATEQKPAEATQATAEPTKVEELPEWAQTLISDTRNEAAQHRVEKNNAVTTAKAQLETEYADKIAAAEAETQTVRNDLAEANLEVLKLKAAIDQKIPHDKVASFAELLKGDDEMQLKSHAEQLKGLFALQQTQAPAVDPSQGSGNHLPLNGDPLLDALKAKVGIS